jgi:hypothetical protein
LLACLLSKSVSAERWQTLFTWVQSENQTHNLKARSERHLLWPTLQSGPIIKHATYTAWDAVYEMGAGGLTWYWDFVEWVKWNDCTPLNQSDCSNFVMYIIRSIIIKRGKNSFLPGSTTWIQKFPANQRSIFVLNLHVHKLIQCSSWPWF